jgi:hypothetical protein
MTNQVKIAVSAVEAADVAAAGRTQILFDEGKATL